ncbi:hypothetical protein HDU76_002375, partial [Blyttiomyces sp. JEL0837]
RWLFKFYCGAFLRSWGSQIRYHGKKPKLNVPHLFVSNHTSVIDYIVLSAHDFPHATVAQTHGGLIGMFEHSVLTLNGSLMFNRNEKKDRGLISQKMRKHVHNPKNVPLLIFPEGTCVNNEYTVLFHKGAFELDAVVVPVAIKYNKQWADAYWHSKTQTFTKHILYLMTRWALVADVWYLPPEKLVKGQSSADFANGVKARISKQAKLKNLSWDGYFKNFAPPKEKQERLKENPQRRYGAVLMNRMRSGEKTARDDRLKNLRRSNSICLGDLQITHKVSTKSTADMMINTNNIDQGIQQPEWLTSMSNRTTETRNEILVQLLDEDRRNDMIQVISDRKNDVVNVWKNYTKLKGGEQQRRLENSSWRIWFKQRIDNEKRKQAIAAKLAAEEEVKRRWAEEMRVNGGGPGGEFNNGGGISSAGVGPFSPGVAVENAINLLSSVTDYFSVPLQLVSGWPAGSNEHDNADNVLLDEKSEPFSSRSNNVAVPAI